MDRVAVPAFEDLRRLLVEAMAKAGLRTQRDLLAILDQVATAGGGPRVSKGTISRLMHGPDGASIRYGTIAHIMAVLGARRRPLPPDAPLAEWISRPIEWVTRSTTFAQLLQRNVPAEFSHSPVKTYRNKAWRYDMLISTDACIRLVERGDVERGEAVLEHLVAVQDGAPIRLQIDGPDGETTVGGALAVLPKRWNMAIAFERRKPIGVLTPFDLLRVSE